MRLALRSIDQGDHLRTAHSSDEAWKIIDARILYQMLNSMHDQIVDLITQIKTIKRIVGDYLEVLYSGQNNLARIYEFSQNFYRVRRDGRLSADFKMCKK